MEPKDTDTWKGVVVDRGEVTLIGWCACRSKGEKGKIIETCAARAVALSKKI